MDEVKVYKPYFRTDKYIALSDKGKQTVQHPEKLVLVDVISVSRLLKRAEVYVHKISMSSSDRQLTSWRKLGEMKEVKCQNPACQKETVNRSTNKEKRFCSNKCGSAYRYSLKKYQAVE